MYGLPPTEAPAEFRAPPPAYTPGYVADPNDPYAAYSQPYTRPAAGPAWLEPPPPTFGRDFCGPESVAPDLPEAVSASSEYTDSKHSSEDPCDATEYLTTDYGLDPDLLNQYVRTEAILRREKVEGTNRIGELRATVTPATAPGVVVEPTAPVSQRPWLRNPKLALTDQLTKLKMKGAEEPREKLLRLITTKVAIERWAGYDCDPRIDHGIWELMDDLASNEFADDCFLDRLEACGWSLKHAMTRYRVMNRVTATVLEQCDVPRLWVCLLSWGFTGALFRRPPPRRAVWFNAALFTGANIGLTRLAGEAALSVIDLLEGNVSAEELRSIAAVGTAASPLPFMVQKMYLTPEGFAMFTYTPEQWRDVLSVDKRMLLTFEILAAKDPSNVDRVQECERARRMLRNERGWSQRTLIEVFGFTPVKATEVGFRSRHKSKEKAKQKAKRPKKPKVKVEEKARSDGCGRMLMDV